MKNIGQIMKQAQQMQSKMAELQGELDRVEITGSSGGGMVSVTLTGKSEMRGIKIDPKLIDPAEVEVLEDLIVAAFGDAKAKVEQHVQDKMSEMTGGLQLPPGMKLPF
ncbi:YbaB/EbfC family nucleoid-associated protein [Rhodospirillaceae bacterium SYSU D60014]|uniref:YbaB/EbfC family nucleoid-associated protein n=1 Tax=Virgifigura deserti TaxID=2268457 RepID=UPI000E6703B3